MESLRCPTFGWDHEQTLITSICCKYSGPIVSMILAKILYRKQYLLTVSLCVELPSTILIRHLHTEQNGKSISRREYRVLSVKGLWIRV